MKLLLADKDYSGVISEAGYILKEDEDNLEALLLRGRAYYYLADHDVALRYAVQLYQFGPPFRASDYTNPRKKLHKGEKIAQKDNWRDKFGKKQMS